MKNNALEIFSMDKKLLIDAAHVEETRIAIVSNDGYLEEFDSESCTKKQVKSNIYLAKVIRIEPSLQAAFVDYGGDRHGFLPFAEIHPDYYRIPVSDRKIEKDLTDDGALADKNSEAEATDDDKEQSSQVRNQKNNYRYKIQEVIQKRQIILVQVVREQRGNKGAALTTYLSLAGRYCVLMPNAGKRSGGISRKISDDEDRKRLKEVLKGLDIPEGMSLIVRTAGHERSKVEIKRDYDYLIKLWEEVRAKTLQSIAPCIIQEESNLIKRAIRDVYSRDIHEVLVEGEQAYKDAKAFMKILIPSHAKKVQPYKDEQTPLFHKYNVEQHIEKMMFPKVDLPSGGSIVINHTEALVAIDVNSGRATRERNVEITAFKTNMEATQEIARQLRLRDLAGLIVVDFIDMEENSNTHQVEKKFKEAIKSDRARIQVGRISQFGLLELSRQRLRPSMMENHSIPCAACHGTGSIRSTESMALQILRAIEREAVKGKAQEIQISVPDGSDLYLLNQKRRDIARIEDRYHVEVFVARENIAQAPYFRIDTLKNKDSVYAEEDESTTQTELHTPKNGSKKDRFQHKKILPIVEKQEITSGVVDNKQIAEKSNAEQKSRSRNRFKNRKKSDPNQVGGVANDFNNTTHKERLENSAQNDDNTTSNIKRDHPHKNKQSEELGAATENSEHTQIKSEHKNSKINAPHLGKKRKPWKDKNKPGNLQVIATEGDEYRKTDKPEAEKIKTAESPSDLKTEKSPKSKNSGWLRRLLE